MAAGLHLAVTSMPCRPPRLYFVVYLSCRLRRLLAARKGLGPPVELRLIQARTGKAHALLDALGPVASQLSERQRRPSQQRRGFEHEMIVRETGPSRPVASEASLVGVSDPLGGEI